MYSPEDVAKNYVEIGVSKTKLPLGKMFVLAVLAGMFIGLAGAGASCAVVSIESASVGKFVGGCIFPAGLAMVLVAGSELFTGNCLIIISVLEKKASISGMLRNLAVVYLGNLVGGLIISALIVYSGTYSLFSGYFAVSAVNTAVSKCTMSFTSALLKGVLCNFLVCIAVWMSFTAKDTAGRIIGLFFPIMLFVLCGFEHCVANMYYIPAGIMALSNPAYALSKINTAGLTWTAFFIKNLIPVTLGNTIGGFAVGTAYWYAYLRNK